MSMVLWFTCSTCLRKVKSAIVSLHVCFRILHLKLLFLLETQLFFLLLLDYCSLNPVQRYLASRKKNQQLQILTSFEDLVTFKNSHRDCLTSSLPIFLSSIEDLLNLVLQFDENIKTSFTLP